MAVVMHRKSARPSPQLTAATGPHTPPVMQRLNFPEYAFEIESDEAGRRIIYDGIRRRFVRLTPEEWVRQHLVRYLVEDRGFPAGYAAVEKGFQYAGTAVRADVVMHDRKGRPILMGECKAPEIRVSEAVFEQLARYNSVIDARYLVATNGKTHFCCEHEAGGGYRFLSELPRFEDA